jgi:hypothetical protein
MPVSAWSPSRVKAGLNTGARYRAKPLKVKFDVTLFEAQDRVGAVQQVGGGEPGDPGTDDRHGGALCQAVVPGTSGFHVTKLSV